MALDISLEQFNAAASGKYNAGELDVERKSDGTTALKKVNAHVHFTLLNSAKIDPANTLEIKEAFVKALSPKLGQQAMATVRAKLGLPAQAGGTVRREGHAYEPLTREQVRTLIDQYAPEIAGTQESGTKSRTDARTSVNEANAAARPVTVGDQSLNIDEIGTDKIAYQGVTGETRARRAQEGIESAASGVMAVLKRPDGGRTDLTALVRKLNTLVYFCERAASLNPAGGAAGRRLEAALARVLDSLDNGSLSLVYQGVMSREVDELKSELSRRLASTTTLPSMHGTCESVLGSISRLEARVASEVAYRTGDETTPPVTQFGVAAPTQHTGDGEMTAANLKLLANRADDSLRKADAKLDAVDARLKSHGFTKVESRKIGDMLRANELTLNIHVENLLGWRDGKPPALADPNFTLRNTFTSKEMQGLPSDGTGYLVKRDEVERYFFPEYGRGPVQGKDRPLYAALNTRRIEAGAAGVGMYGSAVIVLKQHVKQQATYTLNDTFFSLRLDINAASRIRFERALRAELAGRARGGDVDALMDPGGSVCELLDGLFGRNDGTKMEAAAAAGTCNDIAQKLAAIQKGQMRPLDVNDVHAIMIRTMASAESPSDLTATYDNIETLLAKTSAFQAVGFGVHTLRRQGDPSAPVKMVGCDYVEAQLHGPIVLGRDVEEIRIMLADLRNHFRMEYAKLGQPPAGVSMNDWVAQKVAGQKQEIMRMSERSGVKVTFYGDSTDANFALSQTNQAKDIRDARGYMREECRQTADHALGDGLGDVLAHTRMRLDARHRNLMDAAFGADLTKAPKWFLDRVVLSGSRVYKRIDDGDDTSVVDAESTVDTVRNLAFDAVNLFATALDAMERLGVADATERDTLLRMVANERIAVGKVHSYVAANLAVKAVKSRLPALISTSMESDIPKEAREVLAKLGVDGLPIGGKGLENLEGKVRDFVINQVGKSGATSVDSILEAARKEVVLPALNLRVGLMMPIEGWSFPSDPERKAFVEWVANSGRLERLEDVKGAYEAGSLLADRLDEALRLERIDTARLVDIFREMSAAVVRFAEMVAAKDGDFGPDDRRAAMFRPINVALSQLYLRVGNEGMAKLAAALSTADVGKLFVSAGVVALAASKAQPVPDTTPLTQFSRFLELASSRLASKYKVPCAISNVGVNSVADVSGEHVALLRSVAPDCLDAIDRERRGA